MDVLILAVLGFVGMCIWFLSNLIVAMAFSARTMYEELFEERDIFGKILVNVWYAPAWILKGFRVAVNAIIK